MSHLACCCRFWQFVAACCQSASIGIAVTWSVSGSRGPSRRHHRPHAASAAATTFQVTAKPIQRSGSRNSPCFPNLARRGGCADARSVRLPLWFATWFDMLGEVSPVGHWRCPLGVSRESFRRRNPRRVVIGNPVTMKVHVLRPHPWSPPETLPSYHTGKRISQKTPQRESAAPFKNLAKVISSCHLFRLSGFVRQSWF